MSGTEYYPYPARPGTDLELLNFDLESAQTSLSQEELAGVVQFEQGLFNASLDPKEFPTAEAYRTENDVTPIEVIWRKKLNHTDFGVNYFLTSEGKEMLRDTMGVDNPALTLQDAGRLISSLDISDVDPKTLEKLEAASVGYEEEQITKAFIDNGYDGSDVAAPHIVSVYKNPELVVQKASEYRDLKVFIKLAAADLKQSEAEATPVGQAKLLVLELYKQRVNSLLVRHYVSAYKILSLQKTGGPEVHQDLIEQLHETLPAFRGEDTDLKVANFLQRIDRYSHGVSHDEAGELTWLSPEASQLADRAEVKAGRAIDRGIYDDIDPELLETIEVDGETFGLWVEEVLEAYDILSEQKDWDNERQVRAADGKWQAIVDDVFKSLTVSDRQGVVKIPKKSKTILETIKLINHEMAHVLQHEVQRTIGQLSILSSVVGIDSIPIQIEAGGKWQEKVAAETLSGKADNSVSGTSYLKAAQVKEKGGTFGECAQAYFEDLSASNPNMKPEKAAAQAINRTRRIFRAGGFEYAQNNTYLTNTQPMTYLEQQLLSEMLPEEQKKLLFIGGVSINNFVRLAQVGLADPKKIQLPQKMPYELLQPRVAELVANQS